jgi:hypothetical protein
MTQVRKRDRHVAAGYHPARSYAIRYLMHSADEQVSDTIVTKSRDIGRGPCKRSDSRFTTP